MEVYAIYMMVRYRFDIENIYTGKHRIAIYMVIRYRFDIENIYTGKYRIVIYMVVRYRFDIRNIYGENMGFAGLDTLDFVLKLLF